MNSAKPMGLADVVRSALQEKRKFVDTSVKTVMEGIDDLQRDRDASRRELKRLAKERVRASAKL